MCESDAMLTVPTPNGITGINPANAIIVTARGLAGSTLHSTEDGILAVDMLPDELTAALDEALFGAESEQTLWTSPLDATDWPSSIYVAGWQVRSAQPSHGGGCTVAFQGGALQVTLPGLNVAELTDEIGTTSPPWSAGGGGGGTAVGGWDAEVQAVAGGTLDNYQDAQFIQVTGSEGSHWVASLWITWTAGDVDPSEMTFALPAGMLVPPGAGVSVQTSAAGELDGPPFVGRAVNGTVTVESAAAYSAPQTVELLVIVTAGPLGE